jgi:hypothetical protein
LAKKLSLSRKRSTGADGPEWFDSILEKMMEGIIARMDKQKKISSADFVRLVELHRDFSEETEKSPPPVWVDGWHRGEDFHLPDIGISK